MLPSLGFTEGAEAFLFSWAATDLGAFRANAAQIIAPVKTIAKARWRLTKLGLFLRTGVKETTPHAIGAQERSQSYANHWKPKINSKSPHAWWRMQALLCTVPISR